MWLFSLWCDVILPHFLSIPHRKPASGIQYLISKGTLRDTPRSVAKFLKEQNGLSKMKIGEFIGEIRYEFNMAVLEYVGVGWRWRRIWRSGRRRIRLHVNTWVYE